MSLNETLDRVKQENAKPTTYKDGNYEVVEDIDKVKLRQLIECDLIVPQINKHNGNRTKNSRNA